LNIPFGSTEVDCNGVCGGNSHFGDINNDGTTSEDDFLSYKQKMKDNDLPPDPCFDLDASGDISIYDLILLEDCISNNTTSESNPLHTHCDFPKSIINIADSVTLFISKESDVEGIIQVDYTSNVAIIGADFYVSNIRIDSITPLFDSVDIVDLSFENHVIFYLVGNSRSISKSKQLMPLVSVYFSNEVAEETCLISPNVLVNTNREKVISAYDGSCLNFATTAINDADFSAHLDVYPNPATDQLLLQFNDLQGDGNLRINDQFGRLVFDSEVPLDEDVSIDIDALSGGVYILNLSKSTININSIFIKI